jgi:hypothetical protein
MLGRYGQANSRRYCETPRPSGSPIPHSSPPTSPPNDLRCPHAIRSTVSGTRQWTRRPMQTSRRKINRSAHARRSGTGSPGRPAPLAKFSSERIAELNFLNSNARARHGLRLVLPQRPARHAPRYAGSHRPILFQGLGRTLAGPWPDSGRTLAGPWPDPDRPRTGTQEIFEVSIR